MIKLVKILRWSGFQIFSNSYRHYVVFFLRILMKKINLLQKYNWLGEFWFPSQEENKFSGILSYDPKDGVILKIFISANKNIDLKKMSNDRIFGITLDLGFVTLVNCNDGEVSYKFGDRFLCEQIFLISSLIIGKNFEHDINCEIFEFKTNNLDEFIAPQHLRTAEAYSNMPSLSIEIQNSFILSLKKEALGSLLPFRNIAQSLFIAEDEAFYEECNEALQSVFDKYKGNVHQKKELHYVCKLELLNKQPEKLEKFEEAANKVTTLFSYLMKKNIKIMEARFKVDDQWHQIIKSLWLNERDMLLFSKEKDNHSCPIVFSEISGSIDEIVEKWFDYLDWKFNILHKTIIDNIIFKGTLDCMQNYLMLIASVEYFCYRKTNSVKNACEYVVDNYANDAMKDKLQKFLPLSKNSTIGKKLADTRNGIVHPHDRGNKNLDIVNLLNLCELVLHLIMIAIYEQIGISSTIIKKVQDNFTRYIGNWQSL
jgi:hypothetical protein